MAGHGLRPRIPGQTLRTPLTGFLVAGSYLAGEIPVWKQPTGAQDAYMTGDKVYYPTKNDAIYISTVDNNVWAPDVYGWEEVT